ncbi:YcxB family protein [Candidatus Gracilibacteria bacterium]|nr:YcxB family protein [Candidatus Gracilibacteria bacterium]
MKLTTQLSFKDYFYFCKFDTLQRIKKYIIPIYILILIPNSDIFYNQSQSTDLEKFWIVIGIVFNTVILAGLLYIFLKLYIHYIYKKDNKTNQLISGKKEIILNNDYIEILGELYETQLKWNIFNKIIETKQQFLLYTSLKSAYIIPKHSLNKIEIQDLQKILEKKCIDLNLKFQKYT